MIAAGLKLRLGLVISKSTFDYRMKSAEQKDRKWIVPSSRENGTINIITLKLKDFCIMILT